MFKNTKKVKVRNPPDIQSPLQYLFLTSLQQRFWLLDQTAPVSYSVQPWPPPGIRIKTELHALLSVFLPPTFATDKT